VSEHRATISWNRDEVDFTYESYSRDHTGTFAGGVEVPASAAPDFLGTPSLVDPEEAFVASVSSCHMLTFLALAARRRFVVDAYQDSATGFMEENADGKLSIKRIVLDPRISFGGSKTPSPEELERLHEKAHAHCFIANSVRTSIVMAGSAESG